MVEDRATRHQLQRTRHLEYQLFRQPRPKPQAAQSYLAHMYQVPPWYQRPWPRLHPQSQLSRVVVVRHMFYRRGKRKRKKATYLQAQD